MNTVGEPCEGKPHARIDEGRLARPFAEPAAYSTLAGRYTFAMRYRNLFSKR